MLGDILGDLIGGFTVESVLERRRSRRAEQRIADCFVRTSDGQLPELPTTWRQCRVTVSNGHLEVTSRSPLGYLLPLRPRQFGCDVRHVQLVTRALTAREKWTINTSMPRYLVITDDGEFELAVLPRDNNWVMLTLNRLH